MGKLGTNKDFEPFGDYVLLKHIPRATTDGGIALPENVESELPIGKVVRCGPGARSADTGTLIPMPCKEGDTVYFNSPNYRQAVWVEIDHEEYVMVRAIDLMGRLTAKSELLEIVTPELAAAA